MSEKVFVICENKCLIEGMTKEEIEEIITRTFNLRIGNDEDLKFDLTIKKTGNIVHFKSTKILLSPMYARAKIIDLDTNNEFIVPDIFLPVSNGELTYINSQSMNKSNGINGTHALIFANVTGNYRDISDTTIEQNYTKGVVKLSSRVTDSTKYQTAFFEGSYII